MSLASDYAAAYAAAQTAMGAPAPFAGPNGRAEVTPKGDLRLVTANGSTFEVPAQGALVFRDWLTTTFG